jgi:hypothetical protein
MTIVGLLVLTASTLATARTWHVPADAPTIQAGIDSAGLGDDVLVAPGTYFEYGITMKSGVQVHSEQGPGATTVDAGHSGGAFRCNDLEELAVIEGFMIRNGNASGTGGGVRCANSRVRIRDCNIIDCEAAGAGGGIWGVDSDVEIVACRVAGCTGDNGGGINIDSWYPWTTVAIADCEVLNNVARGGVGGIRILAPEVAIFRCVVSGNIAGWGSIGGIGCRSPMLTIRDCLITENWETVMGQGGSGIGVFESQGSISGCTVANNHGWNLEDPAIRVGSGEDDSDVVIERTILAFNEGNALYCGYGSQVAVQCSDAHGNTHSNDLCGTDLGGNFSEDPLFCDVEEGDYTLDGCSPCLPGNHPDGVDCGLIGALGQGCGATPVEETSWGRIKALYRR